MFMHLRVRYDCVHLNQLDLFYILMWERAHSDCLE